ncbi:MAG: hypothetical protein SGI99_02195 [Pseudomonadota bacterium]|nr:hypothetical protein [Pseudomonadota bacterium]
MGAGTGFDGGVVALVQDDGALYAGGRFTSVDGVPANNIARWRDGVWNSLGEADENGTNGSVSALAIEGEVLHGGGSFTSAGGQKSTGYAQWRFHEVPLFGSSFETPDAPSRDSSPSLR